jgi:hypothetical protein
LYQRWLFYLRLRLGGMAYMIYASEGNLTLRVASGFCRRIVRVLHDVHGELARRGPGPI